MTDASAEPQEARSPANETTDAPADAFSGRDRGLKEVALRLYRDSIRHHRGVLALAVVAMAFVAATSGALPFLIQMVADEIFLAGSETYLFAIPALVVVVMSVRAAAEWTARVSEAWLGNRIIADLRSNLFAALTAADLGWLQRSHSGQVASVFMNDAQLVNQAAAKTLTALVKNGLTVVVLIAAMFWLDWRLSLIVLFGLPVAAYFIGRQRRRIRQSVREALRAAGDLGKHVTQTLQGMRVVKAYRQEEAENARFARLVEQNFDHLMQAQRAQASVGPVTEALTGVGFALAILYGGWQGLYGTVSLGDFMGFMTAAMLLYQPLKSLASLQAVLAEGLSAASRVFTAIDEPRRVEETPGAPDLVVEHGRITFERVSFSYGEGAVVLDDFSLDIPAGSNVALVGPSGAGKSTVLNLVPRFFDPSSGRVLIDGQDIARTSLSSLRGACALLTQDPVLFDDSVRANIAYGSSESSEKQLEAAARAAAAHDFISKLPQSYDTPVGEAGGRLSGGEKQRIAFARAMLRDAPILLLDEPTSALDAASEATVQEALDHLLEGRTVIMIAHRLTTVKKADLICVMERGRVVESGTHAALIARGGAYARMHRTQFGESPEAAAASGR